MRKLCSDRALLGILILGLGLRLVHVCAPILDVDSFRQGATASMARNFYQRGLNITDPRVTGWGSLDEPGLWPNEFPFYPYVIACLYTLFGVREVFGRLLTILSCLVGAAALYDIVRRFDNGITARFAALWFLIAPQAIYHGRCFHRHPFAVALMLVAGAALVRWIEQRNWGMYGLLIVCAGLALLMMPPLAIMVVPALVAYRAVQGRYPWRDPWVGLAAAVILLPSLLWYSWAIQQHGSYSLQSYGREGFRDWFNPGYYLLWWKYGLFKKVWWACWDYTLGPIGTTLALLGLFVSSGKSPRLPLVWTLVTLAYYLFDVYPIAITTHYVYFLLLLPPLAWAAGRVMTILWEKIDTRTLFPKFSFRTALVAVIILTTIGYWSKTFRPWYNIKTQWLEVAKFIKEQTPQDARLIVDVFDPSLIYYTERMGKSVSPNDITRESLKNWESQGATHLAIIDQSAFLPKIRLREYLKKTASNVAINQSLRLYKLGGKLKESKERIHTG